MPERTSTPTPQKVDAGKHVVSYTLAIPAEAAALYALVADPHRHHEFDGSGTVRPHAVGPHALAKDAQFTVRMKRFGLPYRLPLLVTRAAPPTSDQAGVVEWRQPTGHRWRWEFEALGTPADDVDGERPLTQVTESFDASRQNPVMRAVLNAARAPAHNAQSIKASLQRLHSTFA